MLHFFGLTKPLILFDLQVITLLILGRNTVLQCHIVTACDQAGSIRKDLAAFHGFPQRLQANM